jgi:hypothetical protein
MHEREGKLQITIYYTLSHSEMECRDFYCSYNGHAHPLPSQFHTLPLLLTVRLELQAVTINF